MTARCWRIIQPAWSLLLLLLLLLLLPLWGVRGQPAELSLVEFPATLECDPCIERPVRIVKVIVHGTRRDAFWQHVRDALLQTAAALRIQLRWDLYETFDPARMAADIRRVIPRTPFQQPQQQQQASQSISSQQQKSPPPDALLVTLPSVEVEEAVQEALRAGLVVFGMNSGYHRAAALGLHGFVGMDEFRGGLVSGQQIQQLLLLEQNGTTVPESRPTKVLFLNNEKGNFALEQRRLGLQEAFVSAANIQSSASLASSPQPLEPFSPQATSLFQNDDKNSQNQSTSIFQQHDATNNDVVDELVVDKADPEYTLDLLIEALRGCPYRAIMTPANNLLNVTLEARNRVCPDMDDEPNDAGDMNSTTVDQRRNRRVFVGSFDTNSELYREIAVGAVDFAVSQQAWLQAALAGALAGLYATSGVQPLPARDHDIFLSGPQIVTIANLPSNNLQVCETEGYPLCDDDDVIINSNDDNNNFETAVGAATGTEFTPSGCLCFDRPRLRLGVVTHGTTLDPFWRLVQQAAQQAAADMRVQLDFDLFSIDEDLHLVQTKMAGKMISLCQEGVDGLIVSVPSALVRLAIQKCTALNVPIVSINGLSVYDFVDGGNVKILHHIGAPDEYQAGYDAGRRLVEAGATQGVCLNHVPALDFITNRCRGFRDAFRELVGPDDDRQSRSQSSYLGMVNVTAKNSHLTVAQATQVIRAAAGDTDGSYLGLLATGNVLVPAVLKLLEEFPAMMVGTFDMDALVGTSLSESDGNLIFGIDQQAYVQGYLPIVLLTWFAQTKQALVNQHISSGAAFVDDAPAIAQVQCFANNFATCLPPIEMELNQLGRIRTIGYVLAVIVQVTAFFFVFFVWRFQNKPEIRRAQPFFLFMVCLGAALMGTSIFALGVDDEIASVPVNDVTCMMAPWLLALGFTVVFAALFSKLVRLNQLIKSAREFRRVTLRVKHVIRPFVILLTLNVVLLTTWTALDPMYWDRVEVSETESYGVCRLGSTYISTLIPSVILVVTVCSLVLALMQSWKARRLSNDFSDSGSIALVAGSILQATIFSLPLEPLVRDDPPARFLVISGLLFAVSMSTLLFTFLPKLYQTSPQLTSMGRFGHTDHHDRSVFLRRESFESWVPSSHRPQTIPNYARYETESVATGDHHRDVTSTSYGDTEYPWLMELQDDAKYTATTRPRWKELMKPGHSRSHATHRSNSGDRKSKLHEDGKHGYSSVCSRYSDDSMSSIDEIPNFERNGENIRRRAVVLMRELGDLMRTGHVGLEVFGEGQLKQETLNDIRNYGLKRVRTRKGRKRRSNEKTSREQAGEMEKPVLVNESNVESAQEHNLNTVSASTVQSPSNGNLKKTLSTQFEITFAEELNEAPSESGGSQTLFASAFQGSLEGGTNAQNENVASHAKTPKTRSRKQDESHPPLQRNDASSDLYADKAIELFSPPTPPSPPEVILVDSTSDVPSPLLSTTTETTGNSVKSTPAAEEKVEEDKSQSSGSNKQSASVKETSEKISCNGSPQVSQVDVQNGVTLDTSSLDNTSVGETDEHVEGEEDQNDIAAALPKRFYPEELYG